MRLRRAIEPFILDFNLARRDLVPTRAQVKTASSLAKPDRVKQPQRSEGFAARKIGVSMGLGHLGRALLSSVSKLHEGARFVVTVLERRTTNRDRAMGNNRWHGLGTKYRAPSSYKSFGEVLRFDA
jgi:hypothetical protein